LNRIVNHWSVVDREQMLVGHPRGWKQPTSSPAGEHYTLHRSSRAQRLRFYLDRSEIVFRISDHTRTDAHTHSYSARRVSKGETNGDSCSPFLKGWRSLQECPGRKER